jgi:hypothetical protein
MRRSSRPLGKPASSFTLWGLQLCWLPSVAAVQKLSSLVIWVTLAGCALLIKLVQLVYAPKTQTEPTEDADADEGARSDETDVARYPSVMHVMWYVKEMRTGTAHKLLRLIYAYTTGLPPLFYLVAPGGPARETCPPAPLVSRCGN